MMLLADKHVLCEKSLTCSVEQSEELFNLAKERKRFLMEVSYYYTPVLSHVFLTLASLSVFFMCNKSFVSALLSILG